MALHRELEAMLQEQGEALKSDGGLKELRWYRPQEFIGDNLFQWVVELHPRPSIHYPHRSTPTILPPPILPSLPSDHAIRSPTNPAHEQNLPITLAASNDANPATKIAVIFGTGCNAAYMERVQDNPKIWYVLELGGRSEYGCGDE